MPSKVLLAQCLRLVGFPEVAYPLFSATHSLVQSGAQPKQKPKKILPRKRLAKVTQACDKFNELERLIRFATVTKLPIAGECL
jgi:hypothetical protein